MTSQHTADYPTLQEVLRLPVFAGCTVCGGAAGLGRRVSGVNLTDTPDYARWLAQGELLITTGFAIADDPQAVDALLPTAAEKGLSGVGIKPGRYLPSPLLAALAEKADRLGLPLLQLPNTDFCSAENAQNSKEQRCPSNGNWHAILPANSNPNRQRIDRKCSCQQKRLPSRQTARMIRICTSGIEINCPEVGRFFGGIRRFNKAF